MTQIPGWIKAAAEEIERRHIEAEGGFELEIDETVAIIAKHCPTREGLSATQSGVAYAPTPINLFVAGKCETCRWWKRDSQVPDPVSGWVSEDGSCENIEFPHALLDRGSFPPDFGCILWEKR